MSGDHTYSKEETASGHTEDYDQPSTSSGAGRKRQHQADWLYEYSAKKFRYSDPPFRIVETIILSSDDEDGSEKKKAGDIQERAVESNQNKAEGDTKENEGPKEKDEHVDSDEEIIVDVPN
uniref:Uncharacterized protein n=1 Tax=Heliothis virescens TaxID=7102 RepID=A0A2A4JJS0_HELVI